MQIKDNERKVKTHIDSSIVFIEKQITMLQLQLDRIGEEIAFDVTRIDKSAQRANKLVFELQKEQFATKHSEALKEVKEEGTMKLPKEIETRIRVLEKHKLNKSDLDRFE